ncbi:MAG: quinohemoprotein amine dehydrogenase subunit alpha [Planctomycetota bacterium]|nr:quinohemoprotein amine dehydrogenase subunit alpha [Planctomycetota bacterium]
MPPASNGPRSSIWNLLIWTLLVVAVGYGIAYQETASTVASSPAQSIIPDDGPTASEPALDPDLASGQERVASMPSAIADYYRKLASGSPQDPGSEADTPDQDAPEDAETPPAPPDAATQDAAEDQDDAEQTEVRRVRREGSERGDRRRNRPGRRGRGQAQAGDPAVATESQVGSEDAGSEGDDEEDDDEDEQSSEGEARGSRSDRSERSGASRKKKPREGIPVHHPLIEERCVVCHARDDDGKMTRISYMRKSPEAWEISIKRMARLYFVSLTPQEAKEAVRYLSEEHGLSRSEARIGMYESERRVHWSEEDEEDALRETCADCHTLGRVKSERRDDQEWKLLKATHLALYPLVDFQSFQGRRSRGGGSGGERGEGESSSEEGGSSSSSRGRGQDRADQVLATLAKEQGLFSEEWRHWNQEKREVPLDGRWIVKGHEVGRGPIRGTLDLKRIATGEYESKWTWLRANGRTVVRNGTGLFYAGHSWRGRSTSTAPGELESLKEVLLLDESWTRMEGRLFTGEYNELGIEIELLRASETPTILGVLGGEMAVPSTGNRLEIIGCGFPEQIEPGDFHLGNGLTVTAVQREDDTRVNIQVDVAAGIPLGQRAIDFRIHQGPRQITLYDTIDGIRIRPNPGFSRVGGKIRPKQLERFEAVAFTRGPDGIPFNEDDVDLMTVPVRWHLEEFPIRPGDDDIQFVGELDAETGVFTPAIDGPNPDRRFNANNIGDVYVVATCTLTIPERKEVKKDEDSDDEDDEDDDDAEDDDEAGHESENGSEGDSDGDSAADSDADGSAQQVAAPEVAIDEGPPKMIEKQFRARGHLLVTVPIYVKWDQYKWNQR